MKEREMYSIGETSELTGMSAKTLRYYDSLNLIIPEFRNSKNNYRYYSKNQVATLVAIQRLRNMGCGIKLLRAVVDDNSLYSLYKQMTFRMAELEEEINERQAIINENIKFMKYLEEAVQFQKEHTVSYSEKPRLINAKIEEIPKSYLFCQQRVMPNYNVTETSVNFRANLYKECHASGANIIGPEVTTYYTRDLLGQFVMRDCLIQMGITVENEPNCGNIREFGGFTAATAIHMGTHENMVNTHILLSEWINRSGYEINGNVSEEFLISPLYTLKPENQVIKVIIPVKNLETASEDV